MKACLNKKGFSMIEVLTAIAVIAILMSIVLGLGKRIKRQAYENLCKSQISIINSAIGQYCCQYYDFPFTTTPNPYPVPDGDNDFGQYDLETILIGQLGGGSIKNTTENEYATSECLYYYLSCKCPNSRKLIDKMTASLVTSFDDAGNLRGFWLSGSNMAVDPPKIVLLRFVDPWGKSLSYTYSAGDAFPVVISAGADGTFGTADDIEVD